MNCPKCCDTGSLSMNDWGYLDCTNCGIAEERMHVETWARRAAPQVSASDAWAIYQHGKAAAASGSAK